MEYTFDEDEYQQSNIFETSKNSQDALSSNSEGRKSCSGWGQVDDTTQNKEKKEKNVVVKDEKFKTKKVNSKSRKKTKVKIKKGKLINPDSSVPAYLDFENNFKTIQLPPANNKL